MPNPRHLLPPAGAAHAPMTDPEPAVVLVGTQALDALFDAFETQMHLADLPAPAFPDASSFGTFA